jgi:suppressor of ftsI
MKNISKIWASIIIMGVLLGFTACQKTTPDTVSFAQKSDIVDLRDGDTYEIVAAPVKKIINGQEQDLIAYNGMLPGPTLRVQQGATIKVLFRNNTSMPNTIHSHGVRMDNASDGIPNVTQKPVAPGETFLYTLRFPDAGVFWYHPHMSEPENQESGLFGNFIVIPDEAHAWASAVDREIPLFFHDILLDDDGEMVSFGGKNGQFTLMGRYGNKQMINWDEEYTLQVKKWEIIRFYMTNASNARPYNIALDGVQMKRVWWDNGVYEHETWEKNIILAPSERSVVEARFDTAGIYTLENQIPSGTIALGKIVVTDDPTFQSVWNEKDFALLHTYDSTIQSIDPLRKSFDKKPDKDITLTLEMKGMMADHMRGMGDMWHASSGEWIEWDAGDGMMTMMNQMSDIKNVTWKIIDNATKHSNMMIDWNFKQWDLVKIRIFNDPKSVHPMQHPIHFHGQRFLVLDINGQKNNNLVWKDYRTCTCWKYYWYPPRGE